MSDVGLGANLELSITEALRRVDQLGRALDTATATTVTVDTAQVAPAITRAVDAADAGITVAADTTDVAPEITRAVDAADTGVKVDADSSDVTGSIDAAVDNADTGVIVTADAADVTGSIDGAVEAANTSVTVTGDASEITGSIDAAVQAGNTEVDVTGKVDEGLQTDVLNLGANIADASDNASALGKVLAGLSIGAAVAAVRSLADAASDLNESASKAGVVFGSDFPKIEDFANGAAEAVGLSSQAAFEATGTFGNLFRALGTSQSEAADLSPKIVQLAGDLASFNNLSVDDTLEKLRSGLVGEIEPLRSLGVSFTALQVEAKATELGLGGVGRELTEGEKVQARYALIMEQTTLAQGDFARTSGGLANQQRILQAELKNAAAAAGTALLPAAIALVDEIRKLVPQFEQIASDTLPAVADAIISLLPLLGSTTDLFEALAPVVRIVAEAIDAIPDGAITMAASLLIANKALGGFTSLFSGLPSALKSFGPIMQGIASPAKEGTAQVGLFARGVTGLASTLAALNPFTLAAAVGTAALFHEWQTSRATAAAVKAQVDGLGKSLQGVGSDFATAQEATAAWLKDLVKGQDVIAGFFGVKTSDVFTVLGLDAQSAAKLIAGGTDAVDEFLNKLGPADRATQIAAGGLEKLAQASDSQVKATLRAKAATGELTGEQERTLQSLDERNAATSTYTALLDDVGASQQAAAKAAEAATTKYGPLSDAILQTGAAVASLTDSAPQAQKAVDSITSSAKPSEKQMLDFALAIDGANLSQEQMAQVAQELGVSVDDLTGFVDTATQAVSDFADTATQSLPTVGDAFSDLNKDGQVSAQEFKRNLDFQTQALQDFHFRIAAISNAGFTELAGIVAQQGPELGGKVAKDIADALARGDDQFVFHVQESLDKFQGSWDNMTDFLRTNLGPKFVLTTGLIGQAATTTFGKNLDFGERLRIAGEVAKLQMDDSGKAVAAIAATEGEDAARRYGDALGLDEKVTEEAVKAGVAIGTNNPVDKFATAGTTAGTTYGASVGSAMGSPTSKTAVQGGASTLLSALGLPPVRDKASATGAQVGEWVTAGVAAGMTDEQVLGQLRGAAGQVINVTRDYLKAKFLINSPSLLIAREVGEPVTEGIAVGMVNATSLLGPAADRVLTATTAALTNTDHFATLGTQLGQNLADGLTASSADVVAAAEKIARDAAVGVAAVSPEVSLAALPGGGTPTGTGDARTLVVVEAGAITVEVAGQLTQAEATQLGEGIADGLAERLAERGLAVQGRAQ